MSYFFFWGASKTTGEETAEIGNTSDVWAWDDFPENLITWDTNNYMEI